MQVKLVHTFSIVIMFILIGCASNPPPPIGVEERVSGVSPPNWTQNPSKHDTKTAKAFVGVSQNMSTEAEARDGALENARKQIIDAMGVYGERKIYEVISSSGLTSDIIDPTVVRDAASKLVSESKVRTRAKEFHPERWSRVTVSGISYYHKAYVLVLYDNADAQEAAVEALRQEADEVTDEKSREQILRARELLQKMESDDW